MNKREILLQVLQDEEILTADGFDDAIIGFCENTYRVIYSVSKCIEILMADDMTDEEAMEYFSFNMSGAYVGEKTPIWCNDIDMKMSDL
jgi:hypothetical protein